MEATAAATTTGSRTIADLVAHSAAAHAEHVAVRYKRDGAWHDVTYAQLADVVQEIGLGLIDLGIEPGERVCILANTRPEWSYVDMAATSAGAVVVPIYQTNSPEECLWVISDSGACAIVCEDDEQLAKIAAIRDQLPEPAHRDRRSTRRPASLAARCRSRSKQVRERGRAGARRRSSRLAARPCARRTRSRSSTPPAPPARPRAACSRTATTARSSTWSATPARSRATRSSTCTCRSRTPIALLIQLAVFDLGGTLAYFGGDTKQIVPELLEVKPTYLPSVPRVFEKIYTLAHGAHRGPAAGGARARAAGDRAGA